MGSFNVGCGLTNLSINEGEKVGFALLLPNKGYKTPQDGGKKMFIYATDDYKPFLPPVFGEYNDYGTITNIQPSTTTKLIEKIFDKPVEDVLNCVGSTRGLYSDYNDVFKLYYNGPKLENAYSEPDLTIDEVLLSLGFTKTENDNVVAYAYEGYSLLKTTEPATERWAAIERWSVRRDSDPKGRTPDISLHSRDVETLLSAFSHAARVYPGFDKKHWEAVDILHSASGMYFLSEPFIKMAAFIGKDSFTKTSRQYGKKHWDELMEEISIPLKEGEFGRWSMKYSAGIDFVQNLISLPPQYKDEVIVYKDDEEDFFNVRDLIEIATSTNRLIMPSYSGEQHGNTEASLAITEITNDILIDRKRRWDDEY